MLAVAIDGPAGAGKSTIAKYIAEKLGLIYVDTGALYRAIGYYVLSKGGNTEKPDEVIPHLSAIEVRLAYVEGAQRVLLNGEDITEEIRTPALSMAASNVSAMGAVREFLFDLQRDIAKENDIIMDGRDIGTVVLPEAQIKIFLTAAPETRAQRRHEELLLRGCESVYAEVLEDIVKRDYNDMNRPIAPLKQAEDAVAFDTTGNSYEQSAQILLEYVKERMVHVVL